MHRGETPGSQAAGSAAEGSAPASSLSISERLTQLYTAALEPWLFHLQGNYLASVLVFKGVPGEAELSGRPPFSGSDAEALENALVRLGWPSGCWCGVALSLPGREALTAVELQLLIETVDPRAILALDTEAAILLAKCFGGELLPVMPAPGQKAQVLGRTYVAISGFEEALMARDGGKAKHRVWKELKALRL